MKDFVATARTQPRVKNDVSDVVEATSIPPCSSSSSRAR